MAYRNKYGAVRTEVDGISFASKAEARRYGELILLSKAGQIKTLVLQPRFKLIVKDVLICTYVADFQYYDVAKGCDVVEDVKGMIAPHSKIKMKLFQVLYPFYDFRIVK